MTDQPTRILDDGTAEVIRFPDLDEVALKTKAINLRCELFQVMGEIYRRGYFGDTDVFAIEDGLVRAITNQLHYAHKSGLYESEHDYFEDVIQGRPFRTASQPTPPPIDPLLDALVRLAGYDGPDLVGWLDELSQPCGDPTCCPPEDDFTVGDVWQCADPNCPCQDPVPDTDDRCNCGCNEEEA